MTLLQRVMDAASPDNGHVLLLLLIGWMLSEKPESFGHLLKCPKIP